MKIRFWSKLATSNFILFYSKWIQVSIWRWKSMFFLLFKSAWSYFEGSCTVAHDLCNVSPALIPSPSTWLWACLDSLWSQWTVEWKAKTCSVNIKTYAVWLYAVMLDCSQETLCRDMKTPIECGPVNTQRPCAHAHIVRSCALGQQNATACPLLVPLLKGHGVIYAPVLWVRWELFVLWGTWPIEMWNMKMKFCSWIDLQGWAGI